MFGSPENAVKGFSHINTDTGIVHNFGLTTTKVIHRTYRTHFGPINVISEVFGASHIDAIHTKHNAANMDGDEDIQIISFIFSARRSKKNDTRCDNENTNGCKEIFIVESINDGLNWSKPILVPRENMDDKIHRHSPSMAYDRESGTIYIVYARTPKEGPSTIGLVKKKVGDKKYERETVLKLDDSYSWSQPKITVTNPEKSMTVFHLSILGSKTDHFSVFYTRAMNNTDEWGPVKDFADGKSSVHFNAISAVGMAGINDLYLAYTSDKKSFLRISENNGETWSEPLTINENAGIVPFMKACGQTKTLGALI